MLAGAAGKSHRKLDIHHHYVAMRPDYPPGSGEPVNLGSSWRRATPARSTSKTERAADTSPSPSEPAAADVGVLGNPAATRGRFQSALACSAAAGAGRRRPRVLAGRAWSRGAPAGERLPHRVARRRIRGRARPRRRGGRHRGRGWRRFLPGPARIGPTRSCACQSIGVDLPPPPVVPGLSQDLRRLDSARTPAPRGHE